VKVRWSAAAVRHLQEVFDYLQGESSAGAITTRRGIMETKRRIGQMPFSGRAGRTEGTREAVVPRTPYMMVYRISDQIVEILGIWHSARLWSESF
jgi:plasmid stabilization system protein ParE